MIKKKYIITALGIISALLASLFVTNVLLALPDGEYDPWIDTNYDGIIDIVDVATIASIYGTEGTPINTTKLLLDLIDDLDTLNASLLNDYYNITDCDSLFALLSHMHSGNDISGGKPVVDGIQLGTGAGNKYIDFYAHGSPVGEWLSWYDGLDSFYLTDDITVSGTVDANYFTDVVFATPKTRYYSIPPSAWVPYRDTYFIYRSTILYTTTAGTTSWYAPVNLPHGAVVTELSVWVYDNDGVADIDVYLYRQTPTGTVYTMANVSSSGASASYQELSDTSILYNPIDNNLYAYTLRAYLRSGNSNHRLSKVCISYTITEPLP